MVIEFLIKNAEGVFVPFDKNNIELIKKILYSKESDENYDNVIFANKDFLNKIPYLEFKINADESFNAIYAELTDGVEDTKYNVLTSKHKNVGNIGFYSPEKDFYILTKNNIVNGKIKLITNDTLYLFFNKNSTEQNINDIKNIISNIVLTVL